MSLSPLICDDDIYLMVDRFLTLSLLHPILSPFYSRIDRSILRKKLASFLAQLFGGPGYDQGAMAKAHRPLHLDNHHFDAVMEILNQVLDTTNPQGLRIVGWKLKVIAMTEAEELREDIIHPKFHKLNKATSTLQLNSFVDKNDFQYHTISRMHGNQSVMQLPPNMANSYSTNSYDYATNGTSTKNNTRESMERYPGEKYTKIEGIVQQKKGFARARCTQS